MEPKNCSICGNQMIRGRVAIRKSILAKLSWPWASDRLFFKPDGADTKTETVIREGTVREAFKCIHCSAILLLANE